MGRRERLQAKVEKRLQWGAKAAVRSEAGFAAARRIADGIPLGQPILVGHHSERGHRRDIARIDSGMRRGVEEQKLSAHHASKAAGLEEQLERSIFSDDENAVEALEARVAELEAKRDRMKLVNRLYKKNDAAGLAEIGLDLERLRAKLAEAGAYWGSAPHLPYELTNLGARIRDAKNRIATVRAQQARSEQAEQATGGVLIEGEEYVRVTFAEKPERVVLEALKAAGFRWGSGSWCGRRDQIPSAVNAMVQEG